MRFLLSPAWPVLLLASACATSSGTAVDPPADSDPDGTVSGPGDGPGSSTDSGTPHDTGSTRPDGPVRLYINELMPANAGAVLVDDTSPDWIELYNPGPDPIGLGGFTLTDAFDSPDKVVLSDELEVPAEGHLVLWASGEDRGGAHLPFKLSADGEEVGLYFPSGEPADRLSYGPTLDNFVLAREVDGSATWVTTASATPGAANEVD